MTRTKRWFEAWRLRAAGSSALVLPALCLMVLVSACGSAVETTPSGVGGATTTSTTGATTTGTGGATGGGGAGAGGALVHPDCAARGGSCVAVSSASEPCPDQFYDPFSGSEALCSTSPATRCCVPTGGLGSTCTLAKPCSDGGCLPDVSGYPPGGYCSAACDPITQTCPGWATCLPVFFSQATGMCLVRCDHDEMCREGWRCEAFPAHPWQGGKETTYVCWQATPSFVGLGGGCKVDSDCLSNVCLPNPADSQTTCAASCDDGHPCMATFACKPAPGCKSPGCGFCFPK